MKVSFTLKRFATFALPATCFALVASTTACGDDDTTDGPVAGTSNLGGEGGTSGSGGKGGSGGSDIEGGTDGGGTSGSGGTAGSGGTSGSGAGGEGAAPTNGGAGGEGAAPTDGGTDGGGGEGPVGYHPAKVNGPDGTLVPGVHDLKAITYSSTGKIWAAGYVGMSTGFGGVDRQVAIVRFNGDGTLDKSFDSDGIKTINLRARVAMDENITNDGDEYAMGMVELANGSVVILANRRDVSGKGRDAVLLKMTAAGVFSSWTAAIGPIRTVDFGWTDAESAAFPGAPGAQPTDEGGGLALSPAKKIGTAPNEKTYPESVVVFGHGPAKLGAKTDADVQRTDNDRYVVRIDAANGAIDATFNAGKVFTYNTTGVLNDNSRRGNVEADGSIIAAGYTNLTPGGNHIVVTRLSIDGVPDDTFKGGTPAIPGTFVSNPFLATAGVAECYQAARLSTGRYVSTGYGRVTPSTNPGTPPAGYAVTEGVDAVQFAWVQSPTGATLDTTFGLAGTLAIQSEGLEDFNGTEERGRDLVVLPDDRFVVAGRFADSPALMVVTKDGVLDATEGNLLAGPGGSNSRKAGVYSYAPLSGTTSHFYAIAKSADGKRVASTTNAHEEGAILAILNLE